MILALLLLLISGPANVIPVFHAPTGWVETQRRIPVPDSVHQIGIWISPETIGNFHPNFNVIDMPNHTIAQERAGGADQIASMNGSKFTSRAVRCHGREANRATFNLPNNGGISISNLEVDDGRGGTIVITYTRRVDTPARSDRHTRARRRLLTVH